MVRLTMIGALLALTAGVVWTAGGQDGAEGQEPAPPQQPPSSQPAAPSTRTPEQVELIKNLLRDRDRSTLVLPQDPGAVAGNESASSSSPKGADGLPLLVDGTMLVERPGRLVREGDKWKFVFFAEGSQPKLRGMEILPNQLLEAMEREAQAGASEFVISAEVTRYQDHNYLLLRKVLRRVDHGNLTP